MIINQKNAAVRILVVDDEPTNRTMMAAILHRFHYQCDEAADGFAACELLSKNKYQLIVADIHMPGNCSLELLDAANELASGVPFILVTAAPSRETAMLAVGTQVRAYLEKPVRMERLLHAVEEALRPKPEADGGARALMKEVVHVLAETRQNFKSRRLGALRAKVENALNGATTGPAENNSAESSASV